MASVYAGRFNPEAVLSRLGDPQPFIDVYVYETDGVTLSTLYVDRVKSATAPNPVLTDVGGNVAFYAEPGQHVMSVEIEGVHTLFNITVPADPAEAESSRDEANVFDFGAHGDGAYDDTLAFRSALAAVADGGKIIVPPGTYILGTVHPTYGSMIPIDGTKKVRIEANGSRAATILKTKAGVGDYVSVFAATTPTTRTDGIEFYGLTFDSNYANNPVPSEDNLNLLPGSVIWDPAVTYQIGAHVLRPGTANNYVAIASSTNVTPGTDGGTVWTLLSTSGVFRERRNAMISNLGTDMLVDNCKFIDSPRQSVFFGGKVLGDVINARVMNCDFVTTADATHDATHDWDCTAVLIRGEDCTANFNRFLGNGTAYFISRLAIQVSGPRAQVNYNRIDKYYRGFILGNPGYSGLVDSCQAIGNEITNCNEGGEYQSLTFSGYDGVSVGVRNVKITDNIISCNKTGFSRAGGDAATPVGVLQRGDPGSADIPVEIVDISRNLIYFDPAYTAGGGSGISWLKDPDNDTPLTSSVNYVTVNDNTIINPGRNGIAFRPNAGTVVKMDNNTVVNPGQRTGMPTNSLAAVRVSGTITSLMIPSLHVVDTRSTHITSYPVYIDTLAMSGRVIDVTTDFTDGIVPTAVFSNNATSLVRVDDVHPQLNSITNDYSFDITDDGKVIEVNKATAVTLTIAPAVSASATVWNSATAYVSGNFVTYSGAFWKAIASSTNVIPGSDPTKWIPAMAWRNNATMEIFQVGVGQAIIAGATGVTVNAPNGAKTARQLGTIGLRYRGSDTWIVTGDTTT